MFKVMISFSFFFYREDDALILAKINTPCVLIIPFTVYAIHNDTI